MSLTGGIMAGIGVAGALGGAAISSNAAQNAAGTQANAADQSAQLQYQASQNALQFQEQQYNQNQSNLQPWLQSGTGALSNLDYLLGVGPQTSAQFNGAQPNGGQFAPSSGGYTQPAAGGAAGSSPVGAPRPTAMAVGGSGQPSGALSGPQGTFTSNPGQSGVATAPGVGAGGQSGLVSGQQGTFTSGPVAGPTATLGGSSGSPVQNPQANPTSGLATAPGYGGQAYSGGAQQGQVTGTTGAAGGGYGSLLSPYPGGQFEAPTAAQAQAYPGEQFMMQQGTQAIQNSAAANGSLLTGGTAKALDAYGQGLASTDYQNVYNNAYNTYSSNYNQYENQQANEYNRLASLAGIGQTAASQLGTLGQSSANAISSNLTGTASAMGQDYQNAAAANASGYVGSANAYSGALNSAGGSISNLLLLNQLQNMGGSGYSSAGSELATSGIAG